jgi:hypothetical protein
MFVLNLFLVLVRIALALASGDLLTVGTVAGARTQEEEFEEEMRSLHLERANLAAGSAGAHREAPKE